MELVFKNTEGKSAMAFKKKIKKDFFVYLVRKHQTKFDQSAFLRGVASQAVGVLIRMPVFWS